MSELSERIVVINPNSSVAVTEGIDAAMAPLRFADGPQIDCLTLAEGPPGIETQRHVGGVAGPLCALIEREGNNADAFVVACFSAPGLHSAREATDRPVMGISESGITTVLTLGERFGIIAILPAGVARHRHRLEDTLGVPVIDPSQAAVRGPGHRRRAPGLSPQQDNDMANTWAIWRRQNWNSSDVIYPPSCGAPP